MTSPGPDREVDQIGSNSSSARRAESDARRPRPRVSHGCAVRINGRARRTPSPRTRERVSRQLSRPRAAAHRRAAVVEADVGAEPTLIELEHDAPVRVVPPPDGRGASSASVRASSRLISTHVAPAATLSAMSSFTTRAEQCRSGTGNRQEHGQVDRHLDLVDEHAQTDSDPRRHEGLHFLVRPRGRRE